MGISTDGIICYGYLLGEVHLPELFLDHEEWAFKRHGDSFKPKHKYPFDADGNWDAEQGFSNEKNDAKDPEQKAAYRAWRDERDAFIDSVPKIPVEFVNVSHINVPTWIAAVPGSKRTASRGYPEKFDPDDLVVTAASVAAAKEFLETHLVPFVDEDDWKPFAELRPDDPSWWLGSDWG